MPVWRPAFQAVPRIRLLPADGADRRSAVQAGTAMSRRFDEQDRKLDVIVALLDALKLGQIMIGAYALLITVLIAVFGLLFANTS